MIPKIENVNEHYRPQKSILQAYDDKSILQSYDDIQVFLLIRARASDVKAN